MHNPSFKSACHVAIAACGRQCVFTHSHSPTMRSANPPTHGQPALRSRHTIYASVCSPIRTVDAFAAHMLRLDSTRHSESISRRAAALRCVALRFQSDSVSYRPAFATVDCCSAANTPNAQRVHVLGRCTHIGRTLATTTHAIAHKHSSHRA